MSNTYEDEISTRRLLKADKDLIKSNFIIPDDTDRASAKVISSQTFQAASQCLLKGQNLLYGTKKLQPSAEAKENHLQGHIFESKVFRETNLWLPKINRELNLTLPQELKKYNCDINDPNAEIQAQVEKGIRKSEYTITNHLIECGQEPAMFKQVTLGSTKKDGRADFVIYSGAPEYRWIIGDIKRSEECMTTFGIQLYFYRHLLEPLISKIFQISKIEAEFVMHKYGVIIHYAKGYTFSTKTSKKEQELCMKHLVVTPVEMDLLKDEFEELYTLLDPDQQDRKPEQVKCTFSNYCIDCQFREGCYAYMIGETTNISLVPMDAAVLEALRDLGITTAEDLAMTAADHPILNDLLEKTDRVEAFIHRAKKVSEYRGYSNWMWKQDWEGTTWFFAANTTNGTIETVWRNSEGKTTTTVPEDASFIVTFTEAERKEAYFRVQETHGGGIARKSEYITLLDDLRNYVHMPLPSYTLGALAMFFRQLRAGKKTQNILKGWFSESNYWAVERLDQDADERMEHVVDIWLGLKYLSEIFHS